MKQLIFLFAFIPVILFGQVPKVDSAQVKQNSLKLEKLNASGATNGQVPKFNSTTGRWEAGNDVGGSGIDTTARYLQVAKYLPNWTAKIGQDEGVKVKKNIILLGDSWFDNTNYIPYYLHEILNKSNTLGGGMFQTQAGNNNNTVTPVYTGTWTSMNMNATYFTFSNPTTIPHHPQKPLNPRMSTKN